MFYSKRENLNRMDTLVEQLKLFDFKHADINMYNVLLELIYTCTPHQCETIINQHVFDIKNKKLLLAELSRFYAVASVLKSIEP